MIKDLQLINLYSNRFLGDFIPIVPLLGLLLLAKNFNLSDISLFFLCLSLTILIAEIPAGMLADAKNARLVIIISRLFKLLAFISLILTSNLVLLCTSAILWGIASALDSGAVQAYTFQLARQKGLEEEFESIYSRTFTASLVGLLCAGFVATQISFLGFETIQYIGVASLLLCVVSAILLAPIKNFYMEASNAEVKEHSPWLFIRLKPALVVMLCIGILAGGIKGSLDEYTSILLSDKNLTIAMIGYILFGLELLKTTGAVLADKIKLNARRQILCLTILGFAFLFAGIGNYLTAITALITILFIDAVLWVQNDTSIQRLATDGNRATLASIKNFGTEALAGSVFVLVWLLGTDLNVGTIYLIGGILLVVSSGVMLIISVFKDTKRTE